MSTRIRGAPQGRAGRAWLEHRLGLARHAAVRLDQKLRILRTEQAHAALLLERTGADWEAALREAETWLLRASVLGGGRAAVAPRAGVVDADVTVVWTTSLGTAFPAEARCRCAAQDPRQVPVSSSAAVEAAAAYRRALEVGVRHAAAAAAARALEAEAGRTRLRLRGVQDRWIPRLEVAAHELRLALDEAEQAEGVRLRWAARLAGRGLP
jgi:V/A-type H+-transporting ATPase subunit D